MTDTTSGAESGTRRTASMTLPKAIGAVAAAIVLGAGIGYVAAQPQVASAQAESSTLAASLSELESSLEDAESARTSAEAQLSDANATVEKLTAGIDPVVLKIDFPMPSGYPTLADLGTVPEHMQKALDTGTGQVVAVAPGVWAAFPPGATVESSVNALAFDGYCASKKAFEAQYLSGQSTSGSCW